MLVTHAARVLMSCDSRGSFAARDELEGVEALESPVAKNAMSQ